MKELSLDRVLESDIDILMTWFASAAQTAVWGGPGFRHPFSRASFHADCHWLDISSYALRDQADDVVAFGQLYERFGRINLARIAVNPAYRSKGVGKVLLDNLIDEGRRIFDLPEFSLFVMSDNQVARRLYLSAGFARAEFPDGAPMKDICHYMTRPVDGHKSAVK